MHEIEAAAELFSGVGVVKPEIEDAVRQLLEAFGEDACREGLERTPERVARMYDELLAGYRVDPFALINEAVFDVDYEEMLSYETSNFTAFVSITCYHFLDGHMWPIYRRGRLSVYRRSRGLLTSSRDDCKCKNE